MPREKTTTPSGQEWEDSTESSLATAINGVSAEIGRAG